MEGRTAVVTGATGGIGRATVQGLALLGAQLAIIGRDPKRTEETARAIRLAGGGKVDTSYSGATAYNQSKLAKLLFTYELARRLQGTSVTANALHPGMVSTGFGAEDPGRAHRLLVPLLRPFMLTAGQGAKTTIHLASAPALTDVSGRFFAQRKPRRSSNASYDQATAAQLWRVSAEMTDLTPTG